MSKLNKDKTRKTDLVERIRLNAKLERGMYLSIEDVQELYELDDAIQTIISDREYAERKEAKEDKELKALFRKKKFTLEPPKYVRLRNTEMRLRIYEYGDTKRMDYFRDGGQWSVEFTEKNGKFYSESDSYAPWLHDVELIPITKEEWMEGNKGYV